MEQENLTSDPKLPPCDHDAYTACPPECAEAKEAWRKEVAAEIARAQGDDGRLCECGYGCPPFNGCRHD